MINQQRNLADTLQPTMLVHNQVQCQPERAETTEDSFIISGSQKLITTKSPTASIQRAQNDNHKIWGDLEDVGTPYAEEAL